MPLPADFIEGEETWRKVMALTNPVHRVREVYGAHSTLEMGYKAIATHAAFQEQHGTQFTELAQLLSRLMAIEHLVMDQEGICAFLNTYRAADQVELG